MSRFQGGHACMPVCYHSDFSGAATTLCKIAALLLHFVAHAWFLKLKIITVLSFAQYCFTITVSLLHMLFISTDSGKRKVKILRYCSWLSYLFTQCWKTITKSPRKKQATPNGNITASYLISGITFNLLDLNRCALLGITWWILFMVHVK